MKRIFFFLMLLLYFTILLITYQNNELYAISGCCMERNSHSGNWRPNGMDYDRCRQLNDARDRDSIFDATGYVWWNVSCR